jgi:RNA-binding protein NOB1
LPKGGKHSNYPILSEDQPRAQNLPARKAWAKTDALDPHYVCQSSPFATRDVYSRSAHLGIKPSRANMKQNKK